MGDVWFTQAAMINRNSSELWQTQLGHMEVSIILFLILFSLFLLLSYLAFQRRG